MKFNKVSFTKDWKKLDMGKQRSVERRKEPLATLSGKKQLYLNAPAVELAMKLGFQYKRVDVYQSGCEFAFAEGNDMNINLYPEGCPTKKHPYGSINSSMFGQKLDAATKCRYFRVRVDEDKFLVITPAYDLDTGRSEVKKND